MKTTEKLYEAIDSSLKVLEGYQPLTKEKQDWRAEKMVELNDIKIELLLKTIEENNKSKLTIKNAWGNNPTIEEIEEMGTKQPMCKIVEKGEEYKQEALV